jgi:hypothetical protein
MLSVQVMREAIVMLDKGHWPATLDLPAGWRMGGDNRELCLAYAEQLRHAIHNEDPVSERPDHVSERLET